MNHAIVATAEFRMKFRTHQICMLCTESENVLLQRDTDSFPRLKFSTSSLLFSQLAAFGRHAELTTNGVGRTAGILADVHDFALDAFEVLPLLH